MTDSKDQFDKVNRTAKEVWTTLATIDPPVGLRWAPGMATVAMVARKARMADSTVRAAMFRLQRAGLAEIVPTDSVSGTVWRGLPKEKANE